MGLISLLLVGGTIYLYKLLFQAWFKLWAPGYLKIMLYGQGAWAAGHAWFWDYHGLIVWSHALNKAVNMCFIYRNNSKRMDLKKMLHEKPGWIVLSGAINVQCHCCVIINSTARCANRVENARSVARSRNRLNHCSKENFTRYLLLDQTSLLLTNIFLFCSMVMPLCLWEHS